MNVGDMCCRDVDLVDLDETAADAARRMLKRNVGTLVALDAEGRPIGLVTDRDLVIRVLAADKTPSRSAMRDVLSAPVRTLPEDAGIDKAVALFRAGSCRRIPVVDAGGKVVGILSLDDVLVLLAEQLGLIAGLVEREAPHPESPGR